MKMYRVLFEIDVYAEDVDAARELAVPVLQFADPETLGCGLASGVYEIRRLTITEPK